MTRFITENVMRLRVVQTQAILFLISMSEIGGSDIERLDFLRELQIRIQRKISRRPVCIYM